MVTVDHPRELGNFLLKCRKATPPNEAEKARRARRRRRRDGSGGAPSLSQEELAERADVSVAWLARIEQGKAKQPSLEVLASLADAMDLSPAERRHMFELAAACDEGFSALSGMARPNRIVSDGARKALKELGAASAVLVNRSCDLLAYTDTYRRLAGPVGLLDKGPHGELPNMARYVFTDPRARTTYPAPHWDRLADNIVLTLKSGPGRTDPVIDALMVELTLTGGLEFRARLNAPGPPLDTGDARMVHPQVGELRLSYQIMHRSWEQQEITIHVPADDNTRKAFNQLASAGSNPTAPLPPTWAPRQRATAEGLSVGRAHSWPLVLGVLLDATHQPNTHRGEAA